MIHFDEQSGLCSLKAILGAFLVCVFLLHIEMSKMLENHQINMRYGKLTKELQSLEDESKSIKASLYKPDFEEKPAHGNDLIGSNGKQVKLISRLSAWSKS